MIRLSDRAAKDVLAAVQKEMSAHSATWCPRLDIRSGPHWNDRCYVASLHLPATTKYVGYGLPLVGNPAFTTYLDSKSSISSH